MDSYGIKTSSNSSGPKIGQDAKIAPRPKSTSARPAGRPIGSMSGKRSVIGGR